MQGFSALRVIFLLSCTILIQGCSALSFSWYDKVTSEPELEVEEHENPVQILIDNEKNDGERLYIKGRVKAKTAVQLRQVVVRLVSLKNGEQIGAAYYPLAEKEKERGGDGMLAANDEVSFSISVPAKEITDYQLELLWGEEALNYLVSVEPAVTPVNEEYLRIEEVQLFPPDCGESTCEGKSYLLAKLKNTSNKVIKALILALELKGAEENVLPLNDLALQPGAYRPLRLEIDLSYEQALKLKPELRVLKVDIVQ
ncbi:MAG: hypothetical protein GYA55_07325 [SAR324 cluster bacterium]|uniref:Uncharacterized protein n=1 Tax=SAR324 cluster bacterium TaxID=2024889 RepID=A0A7X9IJT0_9DELT|nr:hypothetical protein [SAR324 cluster bacterium]